MEGGGTLVSYRIFNTELCQKTSPLTLKELLEFGLVHVVRDVSHKELLGVGIPDHPATLGLPLLAFPNWNTHTHTEPRGVRRRPRSVDELKRHDACLGAHLVWVLCELAEDRRASVPAVSGLSAVSVLWSGTRALPPLEAERVNDTSVRRERENQLSDAHTLLERHAHTHGRDDQTSKDF